MWIPARLSVPVVTIIAGSLVAGPQLSWADRGAASATPSQQAPRCAAPSQPMGFGSQTYVDMQRAGGEPMIHTHPDGTLLYASHAGTTHFYGPAGADTTSGAFLRHYNGQTYAYYSEDNGRSWHYVERTLPPSGAPASGFSDPDFAIDAAGHVYLSEINLVNVAMSRSANRGHDYELKNFFAQTMTDRQWSAGGPEDVVFLVGNAFAGGTFPTDPVGHLGHTAYRSTDGGETFGQGVSDPGGLGDLRYDHGTDTLFEAHLSSGVLQMAAFRDPLAEDVEEAFTPDVADIAAGVDMLSHWPAIQVDPEGNVYITWDESGDGDRAAGVWYSYSTDEGRSWADPVRVDETDDTDIWPWIAVGDEGRVAVAWFGTNEALPDHDAEAAGDDNPWHVYAAQTLNGTGCPRSDVPGFRVVQATEHPIHVGTVCQGGTICQAQGVDRRLGDYFSIEIDAAGRLVAAYSDTRQGGAVALPGFVRQEAGPLFTEADSEEPLTPGPDGQGRDR